MKRTVVAVFTTVVFVEVIVVLIFYMHSSNIKRNFTLKRTQRSQGNLTGNITSIPHIDRTVTLKENSSELASLKNIRTQCSQLTFTFVSHITQPRFEETGTNPLLLVLIPSGVDRWYRTRRNAIRNTWGSGHRTSTVWTQVFVLGKTVDSQLEGEIRNEVTEFNDILVLDIEDNYDNLVIKTFSGFLWGLVHVNPRFILKADDDVYVRVPYLMSWLEHYAPGLLYGGSVVPDGADVRRAANMKNRVSRDCLAQDHYPPYCSGPFYVVSSSALSLIFQSMRKWKAILAEDAYIGLLAHESGLKPVKIPGFEFRSLQDYGRCNWASAVALGHNYDFLEYTYIRNKLEEHSDLPRYYLQCLVIEWAFFILLFVIPTFVLVFLYFVRKVRSLQRNRSR